MAAGGEEGVFEICTEEVRKSTGYLHAHGDADNLEESGGADGEIRVAEDKENNITNLGQGEGGGIRLW